jgi:phosphate transport system permease protein
MERDRRGGRQGGGAGTRAAMSAAPDTILPEMEAPTPRRIVVNRTTADRLYRVSVSGAALTVLLIMALIGIFLAIEAWPALDEAGGKFFVTLTWQPNADPAEFGIAAVMYGTVVIAIIALVIAIPVSIATALFINEYAPRRVRGILIGLVDLLAAIPSLIYGLWGRNYLQDQLVGLSAFLDRHFGWIPIFEVKDERFASSSFIAGVVVSLMVLPICTAVIREVFSQTPPGEKEGALALGSTRWGMIRTVVLPFGRGGIIGGSMLGLGRALGETIAVALIISPVFTITPRILETGGNSVASLIALRFAEAEGLALNALMAAGLMLFIVTLVVNMLASVIVSRSRSGKGVEL